MRDGTPIEDIGLPAERTARLRERGIKTIEQFARLAARPSRDDRRLLAWIWLTAQPTWELKKLPGGTWGATPYFLRPFVWLSVKRDGEHWNPAVGRTVEGAVGKLLRREGLRLDAYGREVKR